MSLINHHGHKILIDHAYSLARVSSSGQSDGEGLDRQAERSLKWSADNGVPLEPPLTITASASKGYHIRKGRKLSPFGKWLELARNRKLKPNPALLVKSMSRLSRLAILDGVDVFGDIVNNDCALVTLSNGRIYTKELINRDKGMMHTVVAELQSGHTDAEAKSDYSRYGNEKRRNKPRGVCPGWLRLRPDRSGHDVIEGAEAILERIFLEVPYLSVDQVAARLNKDEVPVFPCFNHSEQRIWYGSYITKIARSRAVRGEIEIGRYELETHTETVDGKEISYPRWRRKMTRIL